MGRVVVRIMGLASTSKGFAYAVLEGPKRLVGWKLLRLSSRRVPKALGGAFRRMKPLFVAFDAEAASRKRSRGRLFKHFLETACTSDGTLILHVDGRGAPAPKRKRRSNWEIASGLAAQFTELAWRLPAKRLPWQSQDDRIGVFLALAAALSAWNTFTGNG